MLLLRGGVAILHDLNSTNGTYASSSEPPVDRVPLEGTRLALGDSLRFGFCPWIYRLEDRPTGILWGFAASKGFHNAVRLHPNQEARSKDKMSRDVRSLLSGDDLTQIMNTAMMEFALENRVESAAVSAICGPFGYLIGKGDDSARAIELMLNALRMLECWTGILEFPALSNDRKNSEERTWKRADAPAEGDAMGKTGEEVRCTSSREERRQQQLQFAETSYLGWLTQVWERLAALRCQLQSYSLFEQSVREEYAAVRSRAAAEGSPMAHNPSLEELEATCTAFAQRPMCASASWASSPFARTCPLRARSTPGKIRPATAVADLATEEEHKEVDTLEGVVPGPADIEEEQERLSGRSWEVSSILRPPLASAADLESVESQLQEALTFLTETLPALAAEIGEQVSGLVFQALLARSSRPLPGHSGRERCSSERLDGVDSDQVARLVVDAEQLVALLRVKIEDDGDLAGSLTGSVGHFMTI
eukprot:s141_g9.t2